MLYEMTVPSFIKSLHNLSAILDKGAEYAQMKKFDADVLVNSRLAPDQFPLARQIQIACDTAKLCAARLTAKEAPSHADTEKTLPELKARIASTISYLETVAAKDFAEATSRHITQPRWEGQWMTGEEYVLHHAVPNFYFHVTTAYSILRHNGVDIGKKDYLGKLPLKK
ncbi:DUF1993 domain-containing protein [Bdellovibrio sp. 22V]|uniref:DUF1993 domain-containing protein n=1 Tax=Bdellovibrio TaxID=958 RepID=UPI0025436DF3|nr:DUF1993 domain-containing protein [Bdellovibrio sp. 22V]WII70818.1 DUF1993 domain-containing protein [Bdellovibrio sp. 22V]